MTSGQISALTQRLVLNRPFALESGAELPALTLAYRTWGQLSAAADNAIVICHALTGSADADQWWADLLGPGKALDTRKYFVVCSNALGSCYGSSGPSSLAPDGKAWGRRFPEVTIRDQVRAQMALADALGIRRIALVIGGSMGGLQALEWPWLDPERVQAVASIAAAGQHPVWCQAWSEAQRMALHSDPLFLAGDYSPEQPPRQGLAAARAMAMVGYRSPAGLAARFPRSPASQTGPASDLPVRAWLRHHGSALVERFDANCYLRLLDAMDSHDLARGRGDYLDLLNRLTIPVFIGAITSDALYVAEEQRFLAQHLGNSRYYEVDSQHGHDGFLIDADKFSQPLIDFLHKKTRPDFIENLRNDHERYPEFFTAAAIGSSLI